MAYHEYLKNKILSLFFINQKIGKSNVKIEDFEFLNKAFSEVEQPIIPTTKNIEQLFSYIISDFNNNLVLKNKICLDFLEILNQERKLSIIKHISTNKSLFFVTKTVILLLISRTKNDH